MSNEQSLIIDKTNSALEYGVNNVFFVNREGMSTYSEDPRIIISLKGKRHNLRITEKGMERFDDGPGIEIYCSSNAGFSAEWDGPAEYISFVFSDQYIRTMLVSSPEISSKPGKEDTYFHTKHPPSEGCHHLLRTLEIIAHMHEPDVNQRACLLFETLMSFVISDIKNSGLKKTNKAEITWLKLDNYLELHYNQLITRESMAKKFHLSPNYVSNIFRKKCGQSFNQRRLSYQLENAAKLLHFTNHNIKEVAYKCGFNSPSYFTKKFSECYGMSPISFRNETN